MALAILTMSTIPSFAQESEIEWVPLDVYLEVKDITHEHGIFVDRYTFIVDVSNQGSETLFVDLGIIFHDIGSEPNDCIRDEYYIIGPRQTLEITACYQIDDQLEPTAITAIGYSRTFGINEFGEKVLPFIEGECMFTNSGDCQNIQRIDRLIQDVHPEPMICEAPTTTPSTVNESNTPQLLATAYHTIFGDLVLSFDESVTLVDDWHENIAILAETNNGTIGLDGLDIGARNLMPDNSTVLWLSLDFDDVKQLDDITNITLHIRPGAITYGDGVTLQTATLISTVDIVQ
jgi:hypothetical protein